MNTSSLIKGIAAAFPTEPIPQPGEILYNEEAAYQGSFPVDSELAEIKDFFGNRRWDSVTSRDVFRFRHALSFFSKRAFAYFAPAWMTCCLFDEVGVDTADSNLAGSLVRRADQDLWTQAQQHIICEWLSYFGNDPFDEGFREAIDKLGCSQPKR